MSGSSGRQTAPHAPPLTFTPLEPLHVSYMHACVGVSMCILSLPALVPICVYVYLCPCLWVGTCIHTYLQINTTNQLCLCKFKSPSVCMSMIVGALVTWAIYTQGQLLLWSSSDTHNKPAVLMQVWQTVCAHAYDSWSLSHLGYLYPGTTPVMIELDHNRSCPWV